MEIVTTVDQQDNVIAAKPRSELVAGDIYRIAGIWIASNTGSILLAQRKTDKKAEAGKWDTAAAGTVAADES